MTKEKTEIPAIEGGTPIRDTYLVFGKPDIQQPEIDEAVNTLRSGWIGSGPRTREFEQRFCAYQQVGHGIAVASCTAALHMGLIATGLERDQSVLVPAMTFAATSNAVIHAGGRPVFVDIEPDSWLMNLDRVQAVLEKDSKKRVHAIIPVHLAGRCCDMDRLEAMGEQWNLSIISDAAHAIESRWHGQPLGALGTISCYSFYVTKNMTTGEGGMVTSRDEKLTSRIRTLALHGLSHDAWHRFRDEGYKHYSVMEAGFKYNFTDMQAALGLHQLERIERNLLRREEIWERYDRAFADLPVIKAAPPEKGTRHARHLYILLLDTEKVRISRDRLLEALHLENIGAGVHYIAPPLHPYYREVWGCRPGEFPVAEWYSERTFSLPLSAGMTDHDVDDVISALTRLLNYFSA